jgi:hypothetical protein
MPPAILLVGPEGSGKHFITERLAKQLNVELVEINSKTTAEELIEYTQFPVPRLYWLDLIGVPEKAQNKFLKFIEEPSLTVRVIIGAEAEIGILPTVLNRCVKYHLEAYCKSDLKTFSWAPKTDDDLIYQFCATPGALLNLGNYETFTSLYRACEFIIDKFPSMPEANYAMAMSIGADISYKDKTVTKFDFNLFLQVLTYVAFERWRAYNNQFAFEAYFLIIKKRQAMLNRAVAKEAFIFSLLNELWEKSRNDIIRT